MTLPRPHISMKLQRDVALIQLGLDPATAELDHDPALGLRLWMGATEYIPPANDPNYLKWRDPAAHAKKTRGGKATTAGSDVHLIAKGKRLRRVQARLNFIGSNEFRSDLVGAPVAPASRKAKIPARVNPWPKRKFQRRAR